MHGIASHQIDLVLAGCLFMVGRADVKAHLFESENDISSGIFSRIKRTYVHKPRRLIGRDRGPPVFIHVKQKEFYFG